MELIKNNFSISDLENLSGIKAHTIRIWEKRYGLLSPERTKTNIRTYSLLSLKKLLNVAFLNNNGFKISKIAELSDQDFKKAVTSLIDKQLKSDYYIQEFLLAMFAFDRERFQQIDRELQSKQSFEQRFEHYFAPLLHRIGLLWQSGVITAAHEHFIAVLIKEKLLLAIEELEAKPCESKEAYVLFLPDGELHDIGMYYIKYILLRKSKRTIYLGASVPLETLEDLLSLSSRINFVSSFTVSPEPSLVEDYLINVKDRLLTNSKNRFFAWGSVLEDYKQISNKQIILASNLLKIKDLL